MVATLLGWEVERIDLCLPGGGAVVYARVGTWAGNAQGYAGGLAGASLLIGVYLLGIARGERPLRGPGMWFAGLGPVLPIGAQVVLGGLEGAVGPGEDYTGRFASLLPPLVIVATLAVAVAYAWRWRPGRTGQECPPAGRPVGAGRGRPAAEALEPAPLIHNHLMICRAIGSTGSPGAGRPRCAATTLSPVDAFESGCLERMHRRLPGVGDDLLVGRQVDLNARRRRVVFEDLGGCRWSRRKRPDNGQ